MGAAALGGVMPWAQVADSDCADTGRTQRDAQPLCKPLGPARLRPRPAAPSRLRPEG